MVYLCERSFNHCGGDIVDVLVIIVAFFFALLMCLGLILVKWIISQLGATLFFLVFFLMVAVFLLAVGERNYDE